MNAKERANLLQTLKTRFAAHMSRHEGIVWPEVLGRLEARPSALRTLAGWQRVRPCRGDARRTARRGAVPEPATPRRVRPQDLELDPDAGGGPRGNDAWIGYDALIMPGGHIGNGAIVAARAVVVSDVPAYAVVGGNPARVIKERFPRDVTSALEQIAWWDGPIEKVTPHVRVIVSGDVEALEACVDA